MPPFRSNPQSPHGVKEGHARPRLRSLTRVATGYRRATRAACARLMTMAPRTCLALLLGALIISQQPPRWTPPVWRRSSTTTLRTPVSTHRSASSPARNVRRLRKAWAVKTGGVDRGLGRGRRATWSSSARTTTCCTRTSSTGGRRGRSGSRGTRASSRRRPSPETRCTGTRAPRSSPRWTRPPVSFVGAARSRRVGERSRIAYHDRRPRLRRSPRARGARRCGVDPLDAARTSAASSARPPSGVVSCSSAAGRPSAGGF